MGIMDVFSIALSGLRASQTRMQVSANNIANADTPGYKAQRVDSVELSTGGVQTSLSTDDSPGPVGADGTEGSNVDLAAEQVNIMRQSTQYAANAAVVRVANRMVGTLLDMFDYHHHAHERGRRGNHE